MSSGSIALTRKEDDDDDDEFVIGFDFNPVHGIENSPKNNRVSRRQLTSEGESNILLSLLSQFDKLPVQFRYKTEIVRQVSRVVHQMPRDIRRLYVFFIPLDETRCGIHIIWEYPEIPWPLAESDEDDEDQPCCCICLEELLVGSKVHHTPCSHVFHKRCINAWEIKAESCPLCRSPLPSTYTYFEC